MAKPLLKVALANRWATFLCPGELQLELKEFFSYEIPGAEFSAAFRDGSWNGRKNLMARGRVASGLFLEKQKELEENYNLEIADLRTPLKFQEFKDPTLRP